MAVIPSFDEAQLQAICNVLGDTANGLTGSEIGGLLCRCSIHDPAPTLTKRFRLFEAFKAKQRQDVCANGVVAAVQAAMQPVAYAGRQPIFDDRRAGLNRALAFAGFWVGEDGKVVRTDAVRTLDKAEERAGRLRAELERRRVHADVLRACRAELLKENSFHAVLEATKSVAQKIREKSGVTADGSRLVDEAFGRGQGLPVLAFNTLETASERSEHVGMMNLLKGMFGAFRNPTAHEPKVSWNVSEEAALDLLCLASLLHRRLDAAVRTRSAT